MEFSKEFKTAGNWFIPDHEERACFGYLSYDFNKGLHLNLIGSLFGTHNVHKLKINQYLNLIYGHTKDGKLITLLNVFGGESGTNDFIESEFYVEYVCISSKDFLIPEADQFELITVNFNCSEAFFSTLYKRLNIKKRSIESDVQELHFEKNLPKNIYKDSELEAYLFFSYGYTFSHGKQNEFEFWQKVHFNIIVNKPISFTASMEQARS